MRTPLGNRVAATVAVLAIAIGAAACGADDETFRSSPASSTEPAVPTAAGNEQVNVYWGWTIETVAAGSPERLGAGARDVGAGSPAEAAVEALLEGPNAIETEIGMGTSIPGATRLLGVEVSGGVATVDLSGDFNESGGTLGESIRFAQVVFTLTQFDDVDAVSFRIDGADVDMIGSHGFDVAAPIDRTEFDGLGVRPFILLEQPYPGGELASGDRIVGDSNTFEGTVEYAVVDGDGRILGEGFTTASGGNGVWGRFDAPVEFDAGPGGRGAIIVFESSAEDGTPTNVVEYPVDLVAGAPVEDLPATR